MSLMCEMVKGCEHTVTHIGDKGYVYCAEHAVIRRHSGYERCRRMHRWELELVRSGMPLPSYKPGRKPASHTKSRNKAMKSKFLEFNIDALRRATVKEIEDAGWSVGPQGFPADEGLPCGPTIYLCHYEAEHAVMVTVFADAVERTQAELGAFGLTFNDACNVLGTLMDEVATKVRALDEQTCNELGCAAVLYLAGTQAYRLGREQHIDQYVVIRHEDVSRAARVLRPAATHQPGPMTLRELSEFVLNVLAVDRGKHPERFKKDQALRFQPRAP
jgi:hypothetical protein